MMSWASGQNATMGQKRNFKHGNFSEDVALEYPAKMIHEDILTQPNYGDDETKNELGSR